MRVLVWLLILFLAASVSPAVSPVLAQETNKAKAEEAYQKGMALQKKHRTPEAMTAYQEALTLNPYHARAHYEIGWSHWVLGEWKEVVRHFEIAQQLKADVPELAVYLQKAKDNLHGRLAPLVHPSMALRATGPAGKKPADGGKGLTLQLTARFQNYNPAPESPTDRFDPYVASPKSAWFSPDGRRVYVNALEGFVTLVFDGRTLKRLGMISHQFGPPEAPLFAANGPHLHWGGSPPDHSGAAFNRFSGKPVEFAHTHGGRYLWISYYRRDWDGLSQSASAVAIVDTKTDTIVRVMDTGLIPKWMAVSPDGRYLAVIHWGDNTVGLVDIRGDDPAKFSHEGLIVVEHRLTLKPGAKVNRDHVCGFCLRGAVFTADSRHLLVARMGGGGIAVLDVEGRKLVATVFGMPPTPRHLVLSPDGQTLYVGSNSSGYVSAYRTQELLDAAQRRQHDLEPLRKTHVGVGARTIGLSPDGRWVYAAVNLESKVVVLEAKTLAKWLEIPADSFPVGLDVSPDHRQVWVTSQGRDLRGGNSLAIYTVAEE
ncbi:MAG: beta-propeller fold lactonase family protein [Deltaproteobacteria bacterium]|nr:beta-propeller fold lactonase family protein [Deltaproteobacteria bacterium]